MITAASPRSISPRKPAWLRVRAGHGPGFARIGGILRDGSLHTVCEEALCPNRGECWEHGRATIMILGDRCTRGCAFCGVSSRNPAPVDRGEPERVAAAVREMGLRDVVITSVTRDDLPDGGAAAWAETIRAVRAAAPGVRVETLVPDFGGSAASLRLVLAAAPDILGHNMETVPALYPGIRAGADYARSLELLARAHAAGAVTKTSLMLGLGESRDEAAAVMRDARGAGCDIFFLGQYLRPSRQHAPVREYVDPAVFETLRAAGLAMGFAVVAAGPLVRSSYHSAEQDEFMDRVAKRNGAGSGRSG